MDFVVVIDKDLFLTHKASFETEFLFNAPIRERKGTFVSILRRREEKSDCE